jgi:hypothetical protein
VLRMKGRVFASVLVWLAAVASVAGIASVAIDTAGRQVTSDHLAAPLPSDFPATSNAADEPTDAPSSSAVDATVSPSPTTSSHPQRTPVTPSTTPSAAPSQPAVQPGTGTYSTTAGRVRAHCDGQDITLDGGFAQPAPGWTVRVASGGPDEVQVLFEMHGKALLVLSACEDGSPRFEQDRIEAYNPSPPHSGHHGGRAPHGTATALAM